MDMNLSSIIAYISYQIYQQLQWEFGREYHTDYIDMEYKVKKSFMNGWFVNALYHGAYDYRDHRRYYNMYDLTERAVYEQGDVINYFEDKRHGHGINYSNNQSKFIRDIETFNLGIRTGISYIRCK
jgi:hypothetical protein